MGLRELKTMTTLNDPPDVRELVQQNIRAAKKECDAEHKHESVENDPGYIRLWCHNCKTYV